MSTTPPLDITSFTTARERMSLYARLQSNKIVNSRGAQRVFVAQAVTDSVPIDRNWMLSRRSSSEYSSRLMTTDSFPDDRQILRIRILSEFYEGLDPHSFLETPCEEATTGAPETNSMSLVNHTLAMTAKNYEGFGETRTNIQSGDILTVACPVNRRGSVETELATVTSTIQVAEKFDVSNARLIARCSTALAALDFSSATVSSETTVAGATERQRQIDSFWEAVVDHGNVPAGVRVTSTGRTITQGRAMIVRMARARSITVNGDGMSHTENERLRGILTSSHGLAIAMPSRSNHCVGEGCRYGNIVAFDVAGGAGSDGTDAEKVTALEAIATALQEFKDDTGPKGYQALVDAGSISPFASTAFAPNGWKLEKPPEYRNNACHVELRNQT